jgi:hypothetical protein
MSATNAATFVPLGTLGFRLNKIKISAVRVLGFSNLACRAMAKRKSTSDPRHNQDLDHLQHNRYLNGGTIH